MSAWTARAPGKINLCLYIGLVRHDGRHSLVSVVEPLSLADDLVLAPAPPRTVGDEVLCPGVDGPNLAATALAAYRERSGWEDPAQRLTIVKRVPVAAGMAGGSGDAAATLRLAVAAHGEGRDDLARAIAPGLGSDVPAQLRPGPALVAGAGEEVVPQEPLGRHGVLILPAAGVLSAGEVYAELDRLGLARSPEDLAERRRAVEARLVAGAPLSPEVLVNDLEPAARSLCPEIDARLGTALDTGADHAMVSGSGPTVLGFFLGLDGPERAAAAAAILAGPHPRAVAAAPVAAGFGDPAPLRPEAG